MCLLLLPLYNYSLFIIFNIFITIFFTIILLALFIFIYFIIRRRGPVKQLLRDHFWLPRMVRPGPVIAGGGPFMAAIIGPGGPFTAAKNGPGPFLAAVMGPPGPV